MDDHLIDNPPIVGRPARAASGLPAFSPEQLDDPYPIFASLREHQPVVWHPGFHLWLVSRYHDCCAILGSRRFAKEYARARGSGCPQSREPVPESIRTLVNMRDRWFLRRDPPDHTRLKNPTRPGLSSDAVAALDAQIQARVDALLDRAGATETLDIIADLAAPLSVSVMTHILGVSEIDGDLLLRWSQELTRSAEPGATRWGDGNELTTQLLAQLRAIVDDRSRRPREDGLLGHLLDARDRAVFDDEELLATCTLLLFGGTRTTIDLIGNAMLALLQHPQSLRRLQRDPALVPTAVDEALRYDAPLQLCTRVATEDVEFADQHIRAGDWVGLLIGSACRDHRYFADPEVFSLERAERSLLPFGHGQHFCSGMALARAEATHAIATLLRRMPDLEIGGPPQRRRSFSFRGLAALPVVVRGYRPAER